MRGEEGAVAPTQKGITTQDTLMQQLQAALAGKKEEDPNKSLLRALMTEQNKTQQAGGACTLKPNILHSIVNEGNGPTMAEWLATLNKQEEGESELYMFE